MVSRWAAPLTALLLALTVGVTTLFVVPTLAAPAISVRIVSAVESGGTLTVDLAVTSHRASPLPVTAVSAPGRLTAPDAREVYVLADSGYHTYFGSFADVVAQETRIQDQFGVYGRGPTLQQITFSDLPQVMAGHPNAVIVDIEGGLLPSSILPPNSTALVTWISGGGTLVWAGGPLGFFQIAPRGGVLTIVPAGWKAQTQILGYPLTDPTGNNTARTPLAEPGQLEGTLPSPYATALSNVYAGVPYGANVTEVSQHGGIDLGWDQLGTHPRTSLALLPVGYGSLYYFGGALGAYGGPSVADAGYALAIDLARLLGDGFTPAFTGGPTYIPTTVPAFGTVSVSLMRAASAGPSALLVQSAVAGVTTCFGSAPTPASATLTGAWNGDPVALAVPVSSTCPRDGGDHRPRVLPEYPRG